MSAMSKVPGLALLAAAMSLAAAAHAQVYKCVDANGKTVYSQVPCPSGEKSKVLKKDAPAAPAAAPSTAAKDAKKDKSGPLSPAEADMEFRKRQQEKAKADKEAADKSAQASQQQENCQNARSSLAQYEQGGRISKVDEKGERYYLDDNQIAQEREKMRALVSQFCK